MDCIGWTLGLAWRANLSINSSSSPAFQTSLETMSWSQRPTPPSHSEKRLRAFAHVHVERAPHYRAVMRAFVAAKARFVLHLRPAEILNAVTEDPAAPASETFAETLDGLLGQLADWGNLQSHPDTADVATVEDFYRPRLLYQLTPEGEAVERALEVFHEALHRPGELKAAALADIQALLEELHHLADEKVDEGKAHRTLLALRSRFEELTAQAQRFIGGLQRTIDLHGVSRDDFLAYKTRLIDYLERFIGDLVLATSAIAELLESFETARVDTLLTAAAHRDLADALDATEADRERALETWRGRWRGLCAWFIGEGHASQAEILRARARAAIPALLAAAAGLHDRRVTRSDRTSDLRTLARWFAELDDDRDAHRLWRAAFGLAPARHLSIDAESAAERDQQPISPQTSWLEAPPLEISPRLRRTGSYLRRGGPRQVIDRGKEKRLLAELAAAEAEQITRARTRLTRGGRQRLSELGPLERAEFDLFLDLLGEALAARVGTEAVRATSSDGSLVIDLVPADDGTIVTLETRDGLFSGPDHLVEIRDLLAREAVA